MQPVTAEQLKKQFISPSIFPRLKRWGWCDYAGRCVEWWQHQRPNHNEQFEEPRERKPRKQKFVKRSQA